MALQARQRDELDIELDAWLEKEAAVQGSLPDLAQMELDVWKRWNENRDPNDFEWLYNSHQPLIASFVDRHIRSTTLPKAAVQSRVLKNYINALETYDPSVARLSTHVGNSVHYHIPRYIQQYTNLGRIPEQRAGLIDPLKNRTAYLTQKLGRPPSDIELSDDLARNVPELRTRVNPKMVSTLRRELQRQERRAEEAGGEAALPGDSRLAQYITFLHGSLSPEQQLVLEHTYEGFGKPVILDTDELAAELRLSPQKIRAIKKQIARKVKDV